MAPDVMDCPVFQEKGLWQLVQNIWSHPSIFEIISPQLGQGLVSLRMRAAVARASAVQVWAVSRSAPLISKHSGQAHSCQMPHFQALDRKPLQPVAVQRRMNLVATARLVVVPLSSVSSRPARTL